MARAKHKKLMLSGKEEDFMTFMEQFEARMYMLKLDRALRDTITTPVIKPEELAEETQARHDAEAARDDMRHQVWCELVLCLDRRSISFVRSHKPNGVSACKALIQQYRSSERPQVQKRMTRLTGIKMESNEAVTDYLIRAEEIQMDSLRGANTCPTRCSRRLY